MPRRQWSWEDIVAINKPGNRELAHLVRIEPLCRKIEYDIGGLPGRAQTRTRNKSHSKKSSNNTAQVVWGDEKSDVRSGQGQLTQLYTHSTAATATVTGPPVLISIINIFNFSNTIKFFNMANVTPNFYGYIPKSHTEEISLPISLTTTRISPYRYVQSIIAWMASLQFFIRTPLYGQSVTDYG